MFGFFKKKDSRDNGAAGHRAEKSQSNLQPQGPWVQAEALMAQGKTAEALESFAKAAIQTRDLSHMDTAERWLNDQALLGRAGEEAVCRFVAFLTQVLDPLEPVQRGRLWDACLSALRALGCDTPARQDMTNRYTAECVLLRHMGRMEEGLAAAREGIRRHDAASCYTFAGLCCLDLDRAEEAEEYVRQGLERDPRNLAPCNDVADYYFHRRKDPAKAGEYYAMAMGGDHQDAEWAEPSLIYCRWLENRDPAELERLVLCAAAQPKNQRAAQLCQMARQEK